MIITNKHIKRRLTVIYVLSLILLLSACQTATPPEVTDAPDTPAVIDTLPPESGTLPHVTTEDPSISETLPSVTDIAEPVTTATEETSVLPEEDRVLKMWENSFHHKDYPLQYKYQDDKILLGAYRFDGTDRFFALGHEIGSNLTYGFTIDNGNMYGVIFYEYVTIIEKWLDIAIHTYSFTGQRELITSGNVSENNVTTFRLEAYEGKRYFSELDGVIFNEKATELVLFPPGRTGSYTVPDGVTKIADGAFDYSKLSEVILPASVTEVGTAFDKAPNIKIVREESK
ncbi:MAG: hypothetical protein E7619_01310 [Ruminococcaceae bacterium]|nr:hypothetical protein [Oscillospiraceae bacterium]